MPPGNLLKAAHLAFEHEIDSRLQRTSFRDVRPAHLAVLRVLPQEGARLTQLAARANMTKQSMQYLVDRLHAAGFLRKTADATDGRAQTIHGTDKVRRLAETINQITADVERDWAARMGKADFAQLKRLLSQLDGALKGT